MIITKTVYNMPEKAIRAAMLKGYFSKKSINDGTTIITLEGLQWELDEFMTKFKLEDH